jgi:hypothetical protein
MLTPIIQLRSLGLHMKILSLPLLTKLNGSSQTMDSLCIHHFSSPLLEEERTRGIKGVLRVHQAQNITKGNIDVLFAMSMDTIGKHAKMVIQMTL